MIADCLSVLGCSIHIGGSFAWHLRVPATDGVRQVTTSADGRLGTALTFE